MDHEHRIAGSDFVWDADKARANLRKHGVRFEHAAHVFHDPLVIVVDASRNDESRTAAIGFDSIGRLLCVVFLETADAQIRLVSARLATRQEEKIYAE